MKKHIPNFVTILNLLSGCVAIVFAFGGNLIMASWFIAFAAVFDFMDGMLARLLNARSEIGLQLDSLSDVVSFGLAPSFIVYHLMLKSYNIPFVYFMDKNAMAFVAFIIAAFSALRLAIFNTDDSQTTSFKGLPTPANALFIASLPVVLFRSDLNGEGIVSAMLKNYWMLLGITVIFSFLMVSRIRLFSMKVKSLGFRENSTLYIFLILSLVMVLILKLYALPLIVVLYILVSMVRNMVKS